MSKTTKAAVLALALLSLAGCARPTEYRFRFTGPESDKAAFQLALDDWNVCGTVHGELADDGDIPVWVTPGYPDDSTRWAETHLVNESAQWISYKTFDDKFKHIIFAHELGHAYSGNSKHAETGLMMAHMDPSGVAAIDCAWLDR